MSRDPKTPEQLEREIAYFTREIQTRASADRVRRAERAIEIRQRELSSAQQVRRVGSGSGPAPDSPDNALQRVAGADRR